MDELMADYPVQLPYIVTPSSLLYPYVHENLPLNPEPVTTAECVFLVNSVSYRANQR
jgi:hypothetical protein